VWQGMEWSAAAAGVRFLWLGLAFLLLLPARWIFDRQAFAAPAGGKAKPGAAAATAAAESELGSDLGPANGAGHLDAASFLSAPTGSAGRWRFGGLVVSELRLILKGTSLWWYLVAAALIPACLFVPMAGVRAFLFPLAWIWPILKWSPLGTREQQFGTDGLLYSSPAPVWRQLPAAWLAGVLIASAAGSGMGLRLALAGDAAGLEGWLVGALFVPTLALCLGSLSGSSKLFEILYLILWYAGPLNAVPVLDYMGATEEAVRIGMPSRILVITALLAVGAVVAKTVRLRR